MSKKRIVITTNKEIYDKLNMLSFSDEIVLKNVNLKQLSKILNNVNKYSKVIDYERLGDYFLLKREGPLNFSVYFKQK